MDQNLNNNQNDFLWSLLENPANDASSYVYNLHRLVNDFPQSGILQALLAHASEEKNLKRASAYFNPRALFKLINAPTTFTGVPDERLVIQPGIGVNGTYRSGERSVFEEKFIDHTTVDLVIDKEAPVIEAGEEVIDHHVQDELVVDHQAEAYLGHVADEGHHETHPVIDEMNVPEVGSHAEDEAAAVHETAAQETEAPLAEHTAEEATEQIAAAAHSTHTETGAHEHIGAEEAAPAVEAEFSEEVTSHNEQPVEHFETHEKASAESHDEIPAEIETEHPAAEAYTGISEEYTHYEEEIVHAAQESESGVHEEKDEHPVEESTAAELPEQTIELRNEREEPAPVIELPEEQVAEPPAELPVEEEHHAEIPPEIPVEEHHAVEPQPEIPLPEEARPEPGVSANDDTDEVYEEIVGIENINLGEHGGRYFSFDQEFGAHENAGEKQTTQDVAASPQSQAEQQDVSKYHDEKMPYTFMWWLDKTRKEHTQTYQPYIKPEAAPDKKLKKVTDELQQQYFENIFHITSVEELDKSAPQPPVADIKRKEHTIIERFIKEEPQIKPQSSDKLDNENKAKKSSEDRDELVSETLAAIYSDQMLYHKAIASYKKLMLKFPEKSRYFADKIEQLEKKTN